jgi:allantoate deiminase
MDTTISQNIDIMLHELQKFSSSTNGVTRLPFTQEAMKAADYLRQHMQDLGMDAYIDVTGAVHGIRHGKNPKRIIIGSHYDTVKNGGAYDGIAGVICAIETARLLADMPLEYTLEIIALNDEEGIRFDSSYFSSLAFLGGWTVDELKSICDKEGISIYDAMVAAKLIPEQIMDAAWDLDTVRCFMEVHIEQGPVLDKKGYDLGIVQGIVGLLRYEVTLCGQANHAGTTPMTMRHDPLIAAAEVITAVERSALRHPGTVATVGFCKVTPNAINTIAAQVTFSIDIRSRHMTDFAEITKEITAALDQAATSRDITYEMRKTSFNEPAEMDRQLQEYLRQSIEKQNYPYLAMTSGAGHDSQPISRKVPTAMLFVPSKDGMSHCPEEYTSTAHLFQAVHVLRDTILEINKEIMD